MSLTDDWKAGNLNDIWYYVKDNYGNIYPARYVTIQNPKGEYHDSKYSLLHCKNCDATW